jgi:hypothetical protein
MLRVLGVAAVANRLARVQAPVTLLAKLTGAHQQVVGGRQAIEALVERLLLVIAQARYSAIIPSFGWFGTAASSRMERSSEPQRKTRPSW